MTNLPQFIKEKRAEFDSEFGLPLAPEGGINLIIKNLREADRIRFKDFLSLALTQLVEKMEEELKHESLKDEHKKDASTCPVHMRKVREAHNYGLKVGFRAALRRFHLFKTGEEPKTPMLDEMARRINANPYFGTGEEHTGV